MENQHRKIKGYRELDEAEIAMMNRIKKFGEDYKQLLGDTEAMLLRKWRELDAAGDKEAMQDYTDSNPFIWLSRAMQTGSESIMFAVRAVARPTTF